MRLEKQKYAAAACVACGADHRRYLARMVPVIVDEQMAVRKMENFETPARAAEALECGSTFGHVESQFSGEGQYRGRIDHIVLPRNIEGDPGKFLALPAERKGRGKSRGLDVGASISPGFSIRNSLRAPRTQTRRPGVVGTIENFSGRLVE